MCGAEFGSNMSNWRVFMESQDAESQPEAELELSLSEMPIQPSQPAISSPMPTLSLIEAGPSRPLKKPRVEQHWHGNLQKDARALVILLQVGCVESDTHDVTFKGCFEGLNHLQYMYCMSKPIEVGRGHHHWLEGPVNHLPKEGRADYVANTIRRILNFLQME